MRHPCARSLAMKKSPRPPELDELDHKILARYQGDTRISAERLGADVGLSTAAVHRRLKRLRDDGVIEAEIAVIAPEAVGLPLTCIVEIDIDREGAAELDAFAARMRDCQDVQQCFYVTVPYDFIAVVVVADMAAYDAFTRAHLLSDPNVRSFTTHVALSRVKIGLGLSIG
jgi:Lrp/AsnC family transcriptional regulator, leucine-responsive regulatory protein